MLGECRILLSNISLQQTSTDRWVWRLDASNGYTVSGVYHLLTSQLVQTTNAVSDLIWHKHVPLKVSVLVWRLLWSRFLTEDNLFARGVIPHGNRHCVAGCGDVETIQHLFISCPFFLQLCGVIFDPGWGYLQLNLFE